MMLPLRVTTLRFDSLPSTNTEAARQAALGAPEGLCVVAREQTSGRGREARQWVSPLDAGLYFSLLLRPRMKLDQWPLLTLMAALAVRDALKEVCAIEPDIKWPNDIMANERKLCGILAETTETEGGRACILGIGINLNDAAFPAELEKVATSIGALTGERIETEQLLQSLVRALSRRYARLQEPGGPAEVLEEWSASSSFAVGKRVRVSIGDEIVEGWTRGLASDGALRVETDAGLIRTVRAGEVKALRAAEGVEEQL
ncbi:MAG TPA: biotin--[acetyl-CoA-carboxylase] ligase [Pyrinomonadaceae bacterium]|jgi:BirA family biotin operon repressor/biotin-[acetyl-CoA-carboxylase] ligase